MSLPSSSGDRRAATATAPPPVEPPAVRRSIPGVLGGAEQRAVGLKVGAQLGHVGLAQDHRAGRAQPADQARIRAGEVVLERRVAGRGGKPRDVECLLDGDGHAVQRPEPGSFLPALLLARARSAARAAFIAPSRSTTTRALSGPFSRAIRSRCILVASTELRRPFRMARASRVAVSKHGSMHASPAASRH